MLPTTIISKNNYNELFNKEQLAIVQQLISSMNDLHTIPSVYNAFNCIVTNMMQKMEFEAKEYFTNLLENKGPRVTEVRNLARSMSILQLDGFPNMEILENKIEASGPSNKASEISNSELVKQVNGQYLNSFDRNKGVFTYYGKNADNYKTATAKIVKAFNDRKNIGGLECFHVADSEKVPEWLTTCEKIRFVFKSGELVVKFMENKLDMKYQRKETIDAGSYSYLKTELTIPFSGSAFENVFYGFSVSYFYNDLENVKFFDESLRGLPDDIKRFILKFVYQLAGIPKTNQTGISKESFIGFFKSITFDLNENKKNEAFFKKMDISVMLLKEETNRLIVTIPFSFFGDSAILSKHRFGENDYFRIEIVEDQLLLKYNFDNVTVSHETMAFIVDEMKKQLEAFNQTQ